MSYTEPPIQKHDFIPATKKILPFPLENIEEDLSSIYFELDKVRKRIEVVKINNGTSLTVLRKKKLRNMQFKINTTMSFIRSLVRDLNTLWIN